MLLLLAIPWVGVASGPLPPRITEATLTNGQQRLRWQPYPAAEQYKVLRADGLSGSWAEVGVGNLAGFEWLAPAGTLPGFYRVEVVALDETARLTANLLNRIAYGPTPDELERVRSLGPEAYIAEQLAPETIQESLVIDRVESLGGWRYVTATGTASSSTLYIYLAAPGDLYVDDLSLVAGTNAAAGPNLVRNGGFDVPLDPADWLASSNFANSAVSGDVVRSGAGSLHLVATGAGSGQSNALWQVLAPALTNNATYTLSYWYYAPSNRASDLTIRLSGSGITSAADSNIALMTRLAGGWASLSDLRAWHVLHAVQSRRQLLEVLAQFLENHFVTQQSKSRDYLDRYYDSSTQLDRLATRMEHVENQRWRQKLLEPQATFLDLLTISAESPAMIIYLDTVSSAGNGTSIANENYARELFELFCQGVDHGYDQTDIVEMSKVWTGWRIRLVDPTNEFNPLAPQSTTIIPGSTNTDVNVISNLAGVWAFNYRADRHHTNNKTLFAGKTIPARFGPPYTTKTYGTNTVPGRYQISVRGRAGSEGLQEGYEALAYLANLPFTQEYLSVKLCRLLVHEDFAHGVYDYTDPNLSPEGQLVRQCMLAWEQHAPQGQVRRVLDVIFRSELFRSHAAAQQKTKNPLEFTVSAVRALRAARTNGTYTADTDGYSVASPLNRMGNMNLFDRGDPDGYPEAGAPWISAGTLAERLRFVQALCIAAGQTGHTDAGNCVADPVALLQLKLPASHWTNAAAVTDYFLGILFPGEGRANLDELRAASLWYLDTADNGTTASPFAALSPTTTVYATRVRGMAAMLLSSPRFQEQ
jgi:uncharacterized protein (DUF1800 family)